MYSCQRLNKVLADTQILYGLYKKHHWLMRGATFYQLHLLLDKHAGEQLDIIDTIAERVQSLGGVAVGDSRHVADNPHTAEHAAFVVQVAIEKSDAHPLDNAQLRLLVGVRAEMGCSQ